MRRTEQLRRDGAAAPSLRAPLGFCGGWHLPSWTLGRLAAAVAVVWVAAVTLAAHPAFAWEVSKSTNGVIINRGAEDTSTASASIYRYWGYKGGEYWSSGYAYSSAASYDYSDSLVLGISTTEGLELALKPGYRCQLIRITQTGQTDRVFAVLNEPLAVSIENTRPVSVAVSNPTSVVAVSSMPSVSLGASVSVDGTLPVAVDSFGPWTGDAWAVVGLLGIVASGFYVSSRIAGGVA